MSLPPPIPTPVRSGKGIPGWLWALIPVVPALLVVFIVGAQLWSANFQAPMTEWQPKMGVRSIERSFSAVEPAWLWRHERVEHTNGKWLQGGGRKEAEFSYRLPDEPRVVIGKHSIALQENGFTVHVEHRYSAWQVRAEDKLARREACVYADIDVDNKGSEVRVRITEPDTQGDPE